MKQPLTILLLLSLFACKNEPKTSGAETTLTRQSGDTIQKEPAQSGVQPTAPPVQNDESTAAKGVITGSNVTMRREASVQSDKTGSFEQGEVVEILETKNVENDREAILTKPVTVKGSGGEVTLPKGKAVVIEAYQSERNYYEVSYQDPQKGKMSADIDASAVETITYSTWYRVKRTSGETGWVIGKFLKQ
jgi:uncharacterized protein YgiM (DUF1202 family)